jgi:two-component system LytT family response regulator
MKLRCLIVEDEPNAAKLLEEYIQEFSFLELAGKCIDGISALKVLTSEQVDVIFLDINIPGINGLELAKIIAGKKVIFTTAYAEFAVESYSANAVDYLLKPISFGRFTQAVLKLKDWFEQNAPPATETPEKGDLFFIKTGKKILSVEYSQIEFIEGLKEYVVFVTKTEKHIVYKRMKDLEELLPSNFIRVHNSYIVNIQKIRKVEDNTIVIGDREIAISDKYREQFYKALQKKML